jgi:citrate synthase
MAEIVTRIADADATSITVRGKDLVGELIGRRSFTEMFYFLLVKRFPTDGEARLLDACFVTLMEHGFTPSALIARLVMESMPSQPQAAIAAGLLSVGDVHAGTMDGCGAILHAGVASGEEPAAYCRRVVAEHRAARKPVPGFGHPFHKPDDPRTPKLLELAEKESLKGDYLRLLRQLAAEVDAVAGKHITLNATGAMAAILLEIGIPPAMLRSIAVTARCGGLVGHLVEEQDTKSARYIAELARANIPYKGD